MNDQEESEPSRDMLNLFEADLCHVTDALPGYEHLYRPSNANPSSTNKYHFTHMPDDVVHSTTNIEVQSPITDVSNEDEPTGLNLMSNSKLVHDCYDFHGHGPGTHPLDQANFSFGPVTSTVFSEDMLMPRMYHQSSNHHHQQHQSGFVDKSMLDSMPNGDPYDSPLYASMLDPPHLSIHHDLGHHPVGPTDDVFHPFSFLSTVGQHGVHYDPGADQGHLHQHGLDDPDDHGELLPSLRSPGLDNAGRSEVHSHHAMNLPGHIEVILPSPSWASPADNEVNAHSWILPPSAVALDTSSSGDESSDTRDTACPSDVTPLLNPPQFTLKTMLPDGSNELKPPKSPKRPVLVVKGEVRPNHCLEATSRSNQKRSFQGKTGGVNKRMREASTHSRNRSRNSSKSSMNDGLEDYEAAKKINLESNLQLTEDMLRDWKVQDLNRTLKGVPKEVRIKYKKDRRTLKNRVYAHNSRHKKNSELKECKEELARVREAKEKLGSDFDFVFKKLGQCREFLFKVVDGWMTFTKESSQQNVSKNERKFVAELVREAQSEFLGVTSSHVEEDDASDDGLVKSEQPGGHSSCDSSFFSCLNHEGSNIGAWG